MTPFLTHLFATVAIVALTVPGFVRAVRAIPAIDRRALAGQKPWACDVCMCFWSTGIWTFVVSTVLQDRHLVLACGPAYTIAMWILAKTTEAPVGAMPTLEDPELAEKLEPKP